MRTDHLERYCAKLAAIDEATLRTEREEVEAITRSREQGLRVTHRADADPRALLLLSGELPAPRDLAVL